MWVGWVCECGFACVSSPPGLVSYSTRTLPPGLSFSRTLSSVPAKVGEQKATTLEKMGWGMCVGVAANDVFGDKSEKSPSSLENSLPFYFASLYQVP